MLEQEELFGIALRALVEDRMMTITYRRKALSWAETTDARVFQSKMEAARAFRADVYAPFGGTREGFRRAAKAKNDATRKKSGRV